MPPRKREKTRLGQNAVRLASSAWPRAGALACERHLQHCSSRKSLLPPALLLLAACSHSSTMVVPDSIAEAAGAADADTVLEWLATNDVNDVGNYFELTLLNMVTEVVPLTAAHVALAQMLLDRGADATLSDRTDLTPLHHASRGFGEASVKMVSLLLAADGAQSLLNKPSRWAKTPILYALTCLGAPQAPDKGWRRRRIIVLLLRAGASLDTFYRLEDEDEQDSMHFNAEQYLACKELIQGVREAGSWQAYAKLPRKQVLRLRSLALRGRAKLRGRARTRDKERKAIDFIVRSPNEIAWKVLTYWHTELDV